MDPQSPNAAPLSPPAVSTSTTPRWPRAPRSLNAGRGPAWWREGWLVFSAAPLPWVGIVVVVVLIAIALNLIWMLGSIAVALLWPVFTGGILLGCHALAQGRPLEVSHLFAGFQQGRAVPLLILGGIGFVVGLVFALLLMLLMFGAMGFSGMAGMMSGDPTVAMGSAFAGMGVAALIAVPLAIVAQFLFLMAWWFAPALVVLNGAEPLAAIKASFDAAWKNIGALIVFVLILIALAVIATIPFGLGWLVLLPMLFGGMYGSWREVFGE